MARIRAGQNSAPNATAIGVAPPRCEPPNHQAFDPADCDRSERAEGEHENASAQDELAPDAVRERRENQRTEHRSDEAARENWPEHRSVDAKGLRKHRRNVGDHLDVEAVDHDHERA